MLIEKINKNAFFVCLFLFATLIACSQCSDTAYYNPKNSITKTKGCFMFPTERDTTIASSNDIFIIPCSLIDGDWCVKYKGLNKNYLTFKIKNHKMDGEYKYYYVNGNTEGVINYKNNVRNGKAKFYYSNGVLKVKSEWRNGKINGKWKYYNREGKVYHEKKFDDGRIVSEKIYHNEIPEEILDWYKR